MHLADIHVHMFVAETQNLCHWSQEDAVFSSQTLNQTWGWLSHQWSRQRSDIFVCLNSIVAHFRQLCWPSCCMWSAVCFTHKQNLILVELLKNIFQKLWQNIAKSVQQNGNRCMFWLQLHDGNKLLSEVLDAPQQHLIIGLSYEREEVLHWILAITTHKAKHY